jgi:hypothetical protein
MKKEVKEIIEEFDFGKVHNVMTHLNWKWWDEIPTMGKIIVSASEMLDEVYSEAETTKKDSFRSTGGFNAQAYYEGGNIKLQLKFVLTEWDNF